MTYRPVAVYALDGIFLGYSIKEDGAKRLQTMNLWDDIDIETKDISEQIAKLNSVADINAYWPDVRDPEVQTILNDPTFEPPELIDQEVIDEKASDLVFGPEDPLTLVKPLLDEESHIVYTTIKTPSPAGTQFRIRQACEIVARARAEAASNG